jgi:hypothetical protein
MIRPPILPSSNQIGSPACSPLRSLGSVHGMRIGTASVLADSVEALPGMSTSVSPGRTVTAPGVGSSPASRHVGSAGLRPRAGRAMRIRVCIETYAPWVDTAQHPSGRTSVTTSCRRLPRASRSFNSSSWFNSPNHDAATGRHASADAGAEAGCSAAVSQMCAGWTSAPV